MFKQGIPIGRLFGISVRLHYSWFIVFALITRKLGLITAQDVKKVPRNMHSTGTVAEAMTPLDKLIRVQSTDELSSVLRIMTGEDINRLPVMDNNEIIEMIAHDNLFSFINITKRTGSIISSQ